LGEHKVLGLELGGLLLE
jgi:hypothetical protein